MASASEQLSATGLPNSPLRSEDLIGLLRGKNLQATDRPSLDHPAITVPVAELVTPPAMLLPG